MRIDTEISGVGEIYDLLNNVADREARNLMRATIGGMAGELRDMTREEAPRDTGTLKRSIKVKRRRMQGNYVQADVVADRGANDAYYWRFIEYGTSKMAENPFATRALERFQARQMSILLNQFVKKLQAALKRRGG